MVAPAARHAGAIPTPRDQQERLANAGIDERGFTDLFALRTRPNILLAPRDVYETKTAHRKAQWPELEVIPWPDGTANDSAVATRREATTACRLARGHRSSTPPAVP
jgi:hypothetical protein